MTAAPQPLAPSPPVGRTAWSARVPLDPLSVRPKTAQSGYAMLLVFLMAAMIAIALYRELPRIAFEAQRTKEQLLMERGKQYTRAIQLFVRKMSRYPATIEELESTNNIRFLRKRYIDPMTGKDKWRLIHINGGVLTDSIVPKNQPGQGKVRVSNRRPIPIPSSAKDR
jgi:type II secretory pathway pseudopilin PulG